MTWTLNVVTLTAAETKKLLGVQPATLRQWVARGHVIKRGRDAYDMGSVMNYLDDRGEMPTALRLA